MLICFNMLLRNALRGFMSFYNRFYTIGWGGRSICSFAAAKVQKKIDIYKFFSYKRTDFAFWWGNVKKTRSWRLRVGEYVVTNCDYMII